jgi:hypothetical protein
MTSACAGTARRTGTSEPRAQKPNWEPAIADNQRAVAELLDALRKAGADEQLSPQPDRMPAEGRHVTPPIARYSPDLTFARSVREPRRGVMFRSRLVEAHPSRHVHAPW